MLEEAERGSNVAYLRDYVSHNQNRIDVLAVLHEKGREEAEEMLLDGSM